MSNQTSHFDRFLPMMSNADIFSSNLSLLLEFISSSSMLWNTTDLSPSSEEEIVLYHHPILYGTAIYALLLIIVGTMGNLLTIVVLLRPNLRRYTTMRYLTAVAIADLCSLYSWNLNLFYKHLINRYQNDLEDASIISCRLVSFFAFVSLQLSSWYLTLVSVDRCLNIHFLFWHRKFGRADRSLYIILSTTIVIICLNLHLLFLNGYREFPCKPYAKRTCVICYARVNDQKYIFPKWERIHLIVYNFIPFTVMLISTCFIIRRTLLSTEIQRTLSLNDRRGSDRQRKQRQLTYILTAVTFLFVFLTTPVMIYNTFLREHFKKRKPLKYIIQGILLCIQFTSHAINFFVYCHGASKFRHELNEFCSSCSRKRTDLVNQIRTSLSSSVRK